MNEFLIYHFRHALSTVLPFGATPARETGVTSFYPPPYTLINKQHNTFTLPAYDGSVLSCPDVAFGRGVRMPRTQSSPAGTFSAKSYREIILLKKKRRSSCLSGRPLEFHTVIN
jgi:hypothetical protein